MNATINTEFDLSSGILLHIMILKYSLVYQLMAEGYI